MKNITKNAFEEHWILLRPRLKGYLYRLGIIGDDAEDLLQEIAEATWNNIDEVDNLNAYIYKIAFNLKNKHIREKIRGPKVVTSELAHIPDESIDVAESAGIRVMIQKCLAELSEKARRCVELHFYSGLKYHEIGKILGVSESNAHLHYKKGLAGLRKCLSRYGSFSEKGGNSE